MPFKKSLFYLLFFMLSTQLFHATSIHNDNIIKKIILDTKNTLSMDEFRYLTEITEGAACSPELLAKAKEILKIKKRFKTIELKTIKENSSTTIQCVIEPNLILKKIKLYTSLSHKSQYENLYSMQSGDVFLMKNHEDSIKEIKQKLICDGYLKGSVDSQISVDEKNYTTTVYLTINKGPRYYISGVDLAIKFPYNPPAKKIFITKIQKALSGLLNPLIKKYQYNQKQLKNWNKKIKTALFNLGFLKPVITTKTTFDHSKNTAAIIIAITITNPCYNVYKNRICSKKEVYECLSPHISSRSNLQNSIAKHHLKLLCQSKGLWNPDIKINTTADECTVSINEGEIQKIFEIIIKEKNNQKFYLPINTNPKNTICSSMFIKNTLKKITQAAIRKGFWEFNVLSTRILLHKNNSQRCTLEIIVNPGDARKLTTLKIIDPNNLVKNKRRTEELYKNIPFDPEIISNLRTTILSDLYQLGFWHANIDCSLQQTPLTPKNAPLPLSAICTVTPGEQVLSGKLILQGFTKLPFNQILKNCSIKEGSVWDQKKIDGTRSRLHSLEIFEHIKLTPHQISVQENPKHVIAHILDDDPFEARFKLGLFLSNEEKLIERRHVTKISGTYLIKNPLNKADILSFHAAADYNEQQAGIEYRVPDLLGENQVNSFNVKSRHHRYMLNVTEAIKTIKERRAEIKIKTTQPIILDTSQFGWKAGIDASKLNELYGNLKLDEQLINKNVFSVYFTPHFRRISIDERRTMAEGFVSVAECKASFPITGYANTPSIRCTMKQRFAKNLTQRVGISLGVHAGYFFSDGAFNTIHPRDRFLLGGADSIRGYAKDSVPPMGSYTAQDGSTGYTVQGGRSMLQLNAEIRFLLSKNAEFQLFHDMGALSQESIPDLLTKMYRTIGFGSRLYTPLGIVKFDIGWKLDLFRPDEHTYNWHLSFSGSF